jgi:hypothetical protein
VCISSCQCILPTSNRIEPPYLIAPRISNPNSVTPPTPHKGTMADAGPRPPQKRPRDPDFDFAPVILKTIDEGPNFKQMAIAARESFGKAIVASHGEPRESLVLLGGDIKITPISRAQQSSLLSISEIAGKSKAPYPIAPQPSGTGLFSVFPPQTTKTNSSKPSPTKTSPALNASP